MVAYNETRDFEKEEVCCSAFIKYINIIFIELVDKISKKLSPE